MNWAQFKKNGLGMRVQLEPPTWFLDEHSRPVPQAKDDWIVQSFRDPDVVVLEYEATGQIALLGKDHIFDFRSNPARSSAEAKYGFLVLKMQLFVQGDRLWMRPNGTPGEAVQLGAPVDVDAMQRELAHLRTIVAPRRLAAWQREAIAAGLRGKSFRVWIGTVRHDHEAKALWKDICDAVRAAGLEVAANTAWESAQGVGVALNGGKPEELEALKAAFLAAGIELWHANGHGPRLPYVEIVVGSKPLPER